jgi:hypothetical protein
MSISAKGFLDRSARFLSMQSSFVNIFSENNGDVSRLAIRRGVA